MYFLQIRIILSIFKSKPINNILTKPILRMNKTSYFKDIKYTNLPLLNAIEIIAEPELITNKIDPLNKTSKISELIDKLQIRNIIITLPPCEHDLVKNMYNYTSTIINDSLKQAGIDNCIIVSKDTVFRQIFTEQIERNSFLRFFDNRKTANIWLERYEAQITVV